MQVKRGVWVAWRADEVKYVHRREEYGYKVHCTLLYTTVPNTDCTHSPAVDDQWTLITILVDASYSPEEVQKGCGMAWHPKIRPGDKMILLDFPCLLSDKLYNNMSIQ